jgi:hypothetical protein
MILMISILFNVKDGGKPSSLLVYNVVTRKLTYEENDLKGEIVNIYQKFFFVNKRRTLYYITSVQLCFVWQPPVPPHKGNQNRWLQAMICLSWLKYSLQNCAKS